MIKLLLKAIADMVSAEERGYHDLCSLLLSRGNVYRMLGQSDKASEDFSRALELVDLEDKVPFHFLLFTRKSEYFVITIFALIFLLYFRFQRLIRFLNFLFITYLEPIFVTTILV